MVKRLLVCLAALAGLSAGGAFAATALQIRDAWVPEAPPAARVQAAYMELVNDGASAVVVVGAQSPDFARVEIHRTVQAQGIARMAAQSELRVEPGAALVLAPGGTHLMLIEAKRRLVAGDRVAVELQLGDGSTAQVAAQVRGPDGAADRAAGHRH
jgi:copper(I)-binding protein